MGSNNTDKANALELALGKKALGAKELSKAELQHWKEQDPELLQIAGLLGITGDERPSPGDRAVARQAVQAFKKRIEPTHRIFPPQKKTKRTLLWSGSFAALAAGFMALVFLPGKSRLPDFQTLPVESRTVSEPALQALSASSSSPYAAELLGLQLYHLEKQTASPSVDQLEQVRNLSLALAGKQEELPSLPGMAGPQGNRQTAFSHETIAKIYSNLAGKEQEQFQNGYRLAHFYWAIKSGIKQKQALQESGLCQITLENTLAGCRGQELTYMQKPVDLAVLLALLEMQILQ